MSLSYRPAGRGSSRPPVNLGAALPIVPEVADEDPWPVLGLPPNSTYGEAERVFRLRVQLLHPDRHHGAAPELLAEAHRATRQLRAAWERIRLSFGGSDADRRYLRQVDQDLAAARATAVEAVALVRLSVGQREAAVRVSSHHDRSAVERLDRTLQTRRTQAEALAARSRQVLAAIEARPDRLAQRGRFVGQQTRLVTIHGLAVMAYQRLIARQGSVTRSARWSGCSPGWRAARPTPQGPNGSTCD